MISEKTKDLIAATTLATLILPATLVGIAISHTPLLLELPTWVYILGALALAANLALFATVICVNLLLPEG